MWHLGLSAGSDLQTLYNNKKKFKKEIILLKDELQDLAYAQNDISDVNTQINAAAADDERARTTRSPPAKEGSGVGSSRVAPIIYPFLAVENETPEMMAIRRQMEERHRAYLSLKDPYKNSTQEAFMGGERKERVRIINMEIDVLRRQYDILYNILHPDEETETESPPASQGTGLKAKRKFAKGSQEAKDFMKSLRDKRKN